MCNIVFSNLSFLSQHEKTIPAQFSSNLESPDSVSRIFVTLHYICTEISNHQPGMRGGNKEMGRGTRRLYANLTLLNYFQAGLVLRSSKNTGMNSQTIKMNYL